MSECTCIYCDFCDGKGHYWIDFRTKLPKVHNDDLDEMEYCDECGGSGVVEICEYCTDYVDDY